jgi:hypothetical protein
MPLAQAKAGRGDGVRDGAGQGTRSALRGGDHARRALEVPQWDKKRRCTTFSLLNSAKWLHQAHVNPINPSGYTNDNQQTVTQASLGSKPELRAVADSSGRGPDPQPPERLPLSGRAWPPGRP